MFKHNIIIYLLLIGFIYNCDYVNCAALDDKSVSDINSAPPNFCDFDKLCPNNTIKHVGCIKDPSIQYKSNYFLHPLQEEDESIILHRLNSFRDSLASGNVTHFTKSQSITNMKLIMWDRMFQYLSDLMIMRLNVNEYGCIATTHDRDLNQFKIVRIYQQNLYDVRNFLDELFSEITTIIVDRTQPDDASPKIFSYLYNPVTSRIGCSVGSRIVEKNHTEFLIRCIVDGSPIKQLTDAFHYGKPCEKCDKCSDYYPALCAPIMLPEPTEAPKPDGKNSSPQISGGLSWTLCFIAMLLNFIYYKH